MNASPEPVAEAAVKQRNQFDFAWWWDRVGILMVLILLVVLMSIFAPNFNRVDNLLNIARSISVNAILAAGLTFVILTGGIDLSVGSIVAVSGVVAVIAAIAGVPAASSMACSPLTSPSRLSSSHWAR
jgi:ribose transport system permease protein